MPPWPFRSIAQTGEPPPISFSNWAWFLALLTALIVADLLAHRGGKPIRKRQALAWTAFYLALAAAFNVWIYIRFGADRALAFTNAYLIEESLSVDNLFVFLVIFRFFRVAPENQHRILFWGIIGAIFMRLAFILLGSALLHRFHWVIYIFAVVLIGSGIKLLRQKEDEEIDPSKNWVLRLFRWLVPLTTEYEGSRFLVRRNGKLLATPLLLVLVVVETTDLIFAVDSVPAALGITTEPYLVFTSNIFAILGLRTIYFLLAGMVDLFRYLKVGLSLVLIFIGFKMLKLFTIGNEVALGVIAGILSSAVVASLVIPHRSPEKPRAIPPEEEPPPPVPPEDA